ncbi:unnamed protein product [Fraxinus pennsylvanica]|uniref:Endonuclease/exonuclease/phosphatase domain-containing protein n=1 Tax=Fraxinus pennsylvanica TaxID=56036 RepID=A0AAD1YKV0_9LAMI|nr:unnamed protein product [Fraxinus pennsylvanica]
MSKSLAALKDISFSSSYSSAEWFSRPRTKATRIAELQISIQQLQKPNFSPLQTPFSGQPGGPHLFPRLNRCIAQLNTLVRLSLGLLELLAPSPPGFRSIEVLSPPGSRSIEVPSHISLQIMDGTTQLPWVLTGFYGNPVAERRQDSWQMLRRLTPESPSPWLIMGDFNEILSQDEKFTWSNKREGTDFTKERLDRACANGTFPALYGSCVVQVLQVCNSDHNPLSINCNQGHFQLIPNARLLFRYEAAWAEKQECKDIIASSWSHLRGHNSSLGWFKEGLMRCRDRLQFWARSNAREAKTTLKVNMQKLRSLQQVNKGDLNERIRVIQNQVDGQCLGMVEVVLSTELIRTGVGAKVEYGKDFHLFQWQYSAGNKVSRSSCR